MSRTRARFEHTPLDNLVSNLRGEVGELISTWTLLESFLAERNRQTTGDLGHDLEDQTLMAISVICDRLSDDIIAGLSELGQRKVGRLNFFFAARKLSRLTAEVDRFASFVRANRFTEKRNYDISHRELPEKWDEHKLIYIPYPHLLRGLAMATLLMKKIDRVYLGPSAPYLWKEMRKMRRKLVMPLRVKYLLLPYLKLSKEHRISIIHEEEAEGTMAWTKMPTVLNGKPSVVLANQKWGAILLDERRVLVLDNYPLNELKSLETS